MNKCSLKSSQLVNFCQSPLTKFVKCSSVCADDCQVENLISNDVAQRLKGFRVECFIRPPVHLEFHFLAPITIACVIIKPDFTDEVSEMNMTVFTAAQAISSHQQMDLCSRGSIRGVGGVLVMKNKTFQRRHGCKIELSSYSSVVASHITHNDIIKTSEEPLKDMYGVRCLKLSINYFSGPRPISLKWVEVWGTLGVSRDREEIAAAHSAIAKLHSQPAASVNLSNDVAGGLMGCSKPLGQKYNYKCVLKSGRVFPSTTQGSDSIAVKAEDPLVMSLCSEKVCFSDTNSLSGSCTSSKQSETIWGGDDLLTKDTYNIGNGIPAHHLTTSIFSGASKLNNIDIEKGIFPELFMDEITCELMVLPMLLPSGHYVDRSTLEKLQHTDNIYGRPPSDPFTGVAFSEHVQPQFSVELKQQIDNFLSRHRASVFTDETFTSMSSFGRTLGSASDIALHLSSIKTKPAEIKTGQKRRRRCEEDEVCHSATMKYDSTKGDSTKGEVSGKKIKLTEDQSLPHTTLPTDITMETNKNERVSLHSHHELEIASSLDKELNNLLHT